MADGMLMGPEKLAELRTRQCFGKPGSYYVEIEDFERDALFAHIDALEAAYTNLYNSNATPSAQEAYFRAKERRNIQPPDR